MPLEVVFVGLSSFGLGLVLSLLIKRAIRDWNPARARMIVLLILAGLLPILALTQQNVKKACTEWRAAVSAMIASLGKLQPDEGLGPEWKVAPRAASIGRRLTLLLTVDAREYLAEKDNKQIDLITPMTSIHKMGDESWYAGSYKDSGRKYLVNSRIVQGDQQLMTDISEQRWRLWAGFQMVALSVLTYLFAILILLYGLSVARRHPGFFQAIKRMRGGVR